MNSEESATDRRLAAADPFEGEAEQARRLMAGFDGELRADSAAAFLYGWFRRSLAGVIFEPLLGERTWRWLAGLVRNGDIPAGAVEQALRRAWLAARQQGGAEPSAWRWAAHHRTAARHTLARAFPDWTERLDPPSLGMSGDSDTIQAASYGCKETDEFDVTGLSVYRQVVDLADLEASSFVIPGGASGAPGHPHYADQLQLWARHERVPMHYTAGQVRGACQAHLVLGPGETP